MINPEAKLNPKIFDTDLEQLPIRNGYGEGVVLAGEADSNVVVLCADLTESTRSDGFAKKFPNRFFEMGVAEQNLAAVASGFGVSGKIPFISSYAMFSPGRNWEQIRTTIAYNNSNVKIAGAHAGISVGPDGATHQAVEDIAIMRVIPNMKVIVPCDSIEAKKATVAAAKMWGPVYLRFAREKTPVITTEDSPFIPGKGIVVWSPPAGGKKTDVTIFACGQLVYHSILAAKELEKEKINAVVANIHTIKPLDENLVLELTKKSGAAVTVEEHQITGGLGSAIAEYTVKHHPIPMEFIGMPNSFGESGEPNELLEKYGMSVKNIIVAAKRAIKRKK